VGGNLYYLKPLVKIPLTKIIYIIAVNAKITVRTLYLTCDNM